MTGNALRALKRRDYLFSSKVTRSSALLEETKILLRYWDSAHTIKENLEQFQSENVLGKSSRQRVAHVLMPFKQRYAKSQEQIHILAFLSHQSTFSDDALNVLLFFYYLRSDLLVRELATEVLPALKYAQKLNVRPEDIEPYIREWVDQGRTLGEWSDSTIHVIAINALTALRDFGILSGISVKTFAEIRVPVNAFALLAFLLHREEPSGEKLISHPEWRIYNLSPELVEANLIEAHGNKLLEFYAAGSIIRLDFPTDNLEEYARIVAGRTF